MPHLHYTSPYGNHLETIVLLILGIALVILGVVYTWTGEARIRSSNVNRATNPVGFWFAVAVFYFFGGFLVWGVFH
jgi:hypothetical protein